MKRSIRPATKTPKKQPRRVAVLVDTSSSWGRRIVVGIHDYIRKHERWQMFIETRGLQEMWSVPAGWRGDGIIARISNPTLAADLKARNIPVVNVSGIQLPGIDFPRVSTDLNAIGCLAVQHFIDRGFKSFAYCSLTGLSYVLQLQESFAQAVKAAGGECNIYAAKPGRGAEMDWNSDLTQLGEWMKSLPKPVGMLAWDYSSGRAIMFAAELAGLLVPEEVAVLGGGDDDLLCEVLQTPMSGIRAASEQIGHEAARLLDVMMRGGKPPREPIFFPPAKIITRHSTETLAIQDRALARALSFIRENAANRIEVKDVTRHSGVSRRALEQRFMQVLNRTPASEIRRVHLERAKRLLEETDLPIPDVAEAAGYGSPEYMAGIFRAEMQTTPLKYRKEIRGR
jgi:LacI family transcriptional regulator